MAGTRELAVLETREAHPDFDGLTRWSGAPLNRSLYPLSQSDPGQIRIGKGSGWAFAKAKLRHVPNLMLRSGP